MPSFASHPQTVLAARQRFFSEGDVPDGTLSLHIGRSWQRCRDQAGHPVASGAPGVADLPGPEPLAQADFRLRREAAAQLIDSAQPELEALAEQMAHTRSVLILTDAHGLILEEGGSKEFLRRAERVALQPGVDWSEQHCGTNAIGTALIEREALEVRGAEHFLDAHRFLSCAAAPIVSSRGEVLGALDVSGDASDLHLHALALVKLASEQIEHRLMLAQPLTDGRRLLRFHPKAVMLGTPREALLLVDGDRITGANTIALRTLGRRWRDVLDQPLDRIFDAHWRQLGDAPPAGRLHTHGGTALAASMHGGAARAAKPVGRAVASEAEFHASPFEADATFAPLLARAVRVLDAGSAVLLQGETGVGKDVFAGLLHRRSHRAAGPFVAVNCAALPDTLVEAELFGYGEGAFTGAQRKGQRGRIREADGGVLFLDEIGDMPLALQTRLLRVLQERVVTPLGSGAGVAVDFALVCATHRDLAALVSVGQFRADLYWRLQDYTVQLPALRDRTDFGDVTDRLMALAVASAGASTRRTRLDRSAVADLQSRPWPGNLRQLASVLRTVVALAEPGSVIGRDQLPSDTAGGPGAVAFRSAARSAAPAVDPAAAPLRALTAQAIEQALQACDGKVSVAAARLGVHRSTVHRHLAQSRAGGKPRL